MRPSRHVGITLSQLALVGVALLPRAAEAAPLDPTSYTSLAASLAPTSNLTIDSDALTITGDAGLCGGLGTCTGVVDGGVAVFVFDDIDLSLVDVTITGTAPVALLSKGDLVVGGVIDLSATGSTAGSGGFDGGGVGLDGSGPGAGIGDALTGGGGGAFGGDGGDGAGLTAGGTAYGDLLTTLVGGSGGGGGTAGGGGGGSLELGATGTVSLLASSTVLADGGVGDGSTDAGGGGGAGGGVLVHGAFGSTALGTISAAGGAGGDSATAGGGGGGGGGRIAFVGVDPTGGTLLVDGGALGDGLAAADGSPGAAGALYVDADGDGFDSGIDCDDTDPAYDDFLDWYPDCDGDTEHDGTSAYLCVPTGPAGDICPPGGVQPAAWSLTPGTDCDDTDGGVTAASDWYPDCDNDTVFDSAPTNACGTAGADAAFDCVDGFDPDGGWSAVAGTDCNDEDPLAVANNDYYPDCDADTVFDATPVNACGLAGAQTAFDCFDGFDPDGGFDTTAGTDCNDEDPTAQALANHYPDCDGDGIFDSTATPNVCGSTGADAAFDCVDGNDPDGGWSTTPGADCNDEDNTASAAQAFYPDCDGDGVFDATPTNACGTAGADAAFDCVDGFDPDGGWSTTPGTDCNDEDATAIALTDFYPDCDNDTVFSPAAVTNVCGEQGADAAFDCVDGFDPDGGWSGTQGNDCNDEDGTAFQLTDFYPDCDNDTVFDSAAVTNVCGEQGADAAFDCVDGANPDGGWSGTQGNDCNDEDVTAFQLTDFYPDCDNDTVFSPAAVTNVCGEQGADIAFDCVDGANPDGGWSSTQGNDCNDEDVTAFQLTDFYPDCDNDTVFSPAAVTNVCGELGANIAFDCVDGANPDGGWSGTQGNDCNDEDAAAFQLTDWYPDCDADGVFDGSATNACGVLGADVAFDCVDGANPDGGWSATLGNDCNDEDPTGSVVEPWYADCDADGAFSPVVSANACGQSGANQAFDCADGANPDGGWTTVLGDDCNDEDAAANTVQDWYPDCDADGHYAPDVTSACGTQGADAAYDCDDGADPDGGWSLALGDDCDDEEDTTCLDDVQCPDICGDGVDNDCDGSGDFATPGPGGFIDDDGDGIVYDDEVALGTDDCDNDSDNDGVTDDVEFGLGTDPTNPDSDGDTLTDGEEVNLLGTDPLLVDSDGDNVPDPIEVGDVFDPTDTDNDTIIDALDDDDDGDSILTIDEDWNNSGSPLDDESDTDGVPDYLDNDDDDDGVLTEDEVYTAASPLLEDFDGDLLPDYRDDDDDDDGIPTSREATEGLVDFDGDGEPNWRDLDADGDGWSDDHEDTEGASNDADGNGDPDYLDLDSDDDSVPDEFELGNEAQPLAARDTDGDGLEDRIDDDDDNDGRPTIDEVYAEASPLDEDFDLDGFPDFRDDDDDNDGIPTQRERTDGAVNPDGDLEPNWRDLDSDNDGWSDTHEDTEGPTNDADGVGLPDYLDDDSDGDGILDIDELGPETAPLGARDTDGDGLENRIDDDDDGDNVDTATDGTGDTDGDTILDYLDDDDDGDGVLTRDEAYAPIVDPTLQDTDGDSVPDYLDDDDDGDLVPTDEEAPGTGLDTDGDLIPNYRDDDDDGDDVPTRFEFYPPATAPQQQDTDGDTIRDYLDDDDDGDRVRTVVEAYGPNAGDPRAQDTDGDGLPDYRDTDDDGDEVETIEEAYDGTVLPVNQDSDGDTLPDYRDTDDDGDNVDTIDEAYDGTTEPQDQDSDGDGIDDYLDTDDDGDKVPTVDEAYAPNTEPEAEDTDGDNVPDYRDTDDDGDNVPTLAEAYFGNTLPAAEDTDGDGIPDYLDDDDDGDLILTLDEDIDEDDDPTNDNSDLAEEQLDGTVELPDYRDDDDDGDGVPTREEAYLTGDPADQDTDGDGIPDYLDKDDDGDTLSTRDEDLDGDGDPRNDNTDAGRESETLPNYRDPDDDEDFAPTAAEVAVGSDELRVDTDNDAIIDGYEFVNPFIEANRLAHPELYAGDDSYDDVDCTDDCEPSGTNRCEDIGGGTTGTGFFDPWDRDGDGIPNVLDLDDDGDGINSIDEGNVASECPVTGKDPGEVPDFIPNYLDFDSDGDGICDIDEVPGDADGDGIQERLDCDEDGCQGDADYDGIPNCQEVSICEDHADLCLAFEVPLGLPQLDPDLDNDGIPDGAEVTDPECYDPISQACQPDDTDGDGAPNLLDLDDDGDGYDTPTELGCATVAYVDSNTENPQTLCDAKPFTPQNTDADIGEVLPLEPDEVPDYLDTDDDGDGKPTDASAPTMNTTPANPEGSGDFDADGTLDYLDPYEFDGPDADADGDGLTNGQEATLGTNAYNGDSDNDGIDDGTEVGDPNAPTDSDFDGLIDALDDDDDDDGVPTAEEGTADPDGDGVPNYLDLDSNGDGIDDAPGDTADDDCDGIPFYLDTDPLDGPCGPVDPPYEPPVYERQPCTCAAATSTSTAGWLLGLAALLVVRRRQA